jgi:hypothetical protein
MAKVELHVRVTYSPQKFAQLRQAYASHPSELAKLAKKDLSVLKIPFPRTDSMSLVVPNIFECFWVGHIGSVSPFPGPVDCDKG